MRARPLSAAATGAARRANVGDLSIDLAYRPRRNGRSKLSDHAKLPLSLFFAEPPDAFVKVSYGVADDLTLRLIESFCRLL